jgi:hypothetical protein
MPAKSNRQRKYLYATKGAKWVKEHHFDEVEKERPKRKRRSKR